MNPETAVLEQEPIAQPTEGDSQVDELEGINPDALEDEQPVEPEAKQEEPPRRTLDELSDEEVLGNERVAELLRRRSQSEKDKAIADQARSFRQQAAEYVQRGGFAQTLQAALKQAIDGDGELDGRAIQQASNNLWAYLSTENWNMLSGAIIGMMPKDANLPQELVRGMQVAADNLVTGRGDYGQLAQSQLSALVHAKIEEERPKIAREERRKVIEQLRAKSATEQMKAADASRTGGPTNITSGAPAIADLDTILRTAPPNSTEFRTAYRTKHGFDP